MSEEIIDILENGMQHTQSIAKISFNDIDEITQQWIEIGELSGELAIQLIEGAPREIKVTFNGDVAKQETDLITT